MRSPSALRRSGSARERTAVAFSEPQSERPQSLSTSSADVLVAGSSMSAHVASISLSRNGLLTHHLRDAHEQGHAPPSPVQRAAHSLGVVSSDEPLVTFSAAPETTHHAIHAYSPSYCITCDALLDMRSDNDSTIELTGSESSTVADDSLVVVREMANSDGSDDGSAGVRAASELIHRLRDANVDQKATFHEGRTALQSLVSAESSKVVLAFFSSSSCGPCGRLRPIVKRAVEQEATGGANVALVELDIDGEPELAMSAGVTSTPEVHYYLGGKWVNSLTGVRNKREYRNAIQGLSRLPES